MHRLDHFFGAHRLRVKPPWCLIDMQRAANQRATRTRNDETNFFGESVKSRRAFGVEQKTDVFAEAEGVNCNPKLGQGRTKWPARDVQQIAQEIPGEFLPPISLGKL